MVWMFVFQPGGGRKTNNDTAAQVEKETMAGGQKIHQPGQVALVSKTSYL